MFHGSVFIFVTGKKLKVAGKMSGEKINRGCCVAGVDIMG